jgi:hypothetical protein
MGSNYNIKNFDIARMSNEGIVSLVFVNLSEAQEFGKILE